MSVLQTIERTIEGVVQRGFGRVFRSRLQPVELARKLGREMDDSKRVSVSGVYGANEFTVYLSPGDRASIASFEASLASELSVYLQAHAREQQLTLISAPSITFVTDDDLVAGEFGIAARIADPPPPAPQAASGSPAQPPIPEAPRVADTPVAPTPDAAPVVVAAAAAQSVVGTSPVSRPQTAPPPRPAPNDALRGVQGTQIITPDQARAEGLVRDEMVTLAFGGTRHRISKRTTTVGRSRECDVTIPDANVSRVHFEIRNVDSEYSLVDMKSTNGTLVNGKPVKHHRLQDGDRIDVGSTTIDVERT
ncbi:MAG: DUF3662 domain-containing protein [Actinobacteria bacterium]|nr:DUF3662 domain-containing protein [Actinomycetota bacterium]